MAEADHDREQEQRDEHPQVPERERDRDDGDGDRRGDERLAGSLAHRMILAVHWPDKRGDRCGRRCAGLATAPLRL